MSAKARNARLAKARAKKRKKLTAVRHAEVQDQGETLNSTGHSLVHMVVSQTVMTRSACARRFRSTRRRGRCDH